MSLDCVKVADHILSAAIRADERMAEVKRRVDDVRVSIGHHGIGEINTTSLTIEFLSFAIQELEAVPYYQLLNELRVLRSRQEKILKEEKAVNETKES